MPSLCNECKLFWRFTTNPLIRVGRWSALMNKTSNCLVTRVQKSWFARERRGDVTMNMSGVAHVICLSLFRLNWVYGRF